MAYLWRCGSEDEATDALAVDVEELALKLLGCVGALGRLRIRGVVYGGRGVIQFLFLDIVFARTSDRSIPGPLPGGPAGRRAHEDVEKLAGQG